MRHFTVGALCTLLLLVALVSGVAFGTERVSLVRALTESGSLDHEIVFAVRLPRVLLAALAGGGLSIAGVALQALLRNDLAEPFVLGVSGGAALGATVAIVFGLTAASTIGASVLPLTAFAGGLCATILVYIFARTSSGPRSTSLLLSGIVMNAIASAAITFAKTIVSPAKAQELLFWLMGFVDVPNFESLVAIAAYLAVGVAILLRDAGRLNVLSLGEEAATHLGVRVQAVEARVVFASSLIVGAIVSATGLIGFVGLIVPHVLRRILGPDTRVLMPVSVFAGAAALVACDLGSRAVFRWIHTEPPVGTVTALVGGPMFLALLQRRAYR